ncbi:uncharacterized protein LOC106152641 isoform X2 [Lingula anatina]|uniref:Uncharacterized protein LOC106152641 isoform X2 n=1 Tax=Lingula anatina TaxID=7574 RepID=A0A1S3H6Y8_LINAN|nr:uncharacterized protein LOC106152641 isoform X2 [Lingula anatina]|eukprot:XP_013381763.1 uncharacterized protein LOC106152641 isoform X2 [Lingula anatina]
MKSGYITCILLCHTLLGAQTRSTIKPIKSTTQHIRKPSQKYHTYGNPTFPWPKYEPPRYIPKEPETWPPIAIALGIPFNKPKGYGVWSHLWPPRWPPKPQRILPEKSYPFKPKPEDDEKKKERKRRRKYPFGLKMMEHPGKAGKAFAHAKLPYRMRHQFGDNSNLVWLKNVSEKQLEELQEYTDVFELIEPDLITNITCTTYNASGFYRWGLDRLDNVDLAVAYDSSFKMTTAGIGVDIYVVDTGINKDHEDFGGRVTYGYSITSTAADDHGHGTHVAGILGGTKYGVAKDANIIAVKVIDKDGTGTVSDFLNGIQWIQDQIRITKRKSVVNVSLRWPLSESANSAVEGLVKDGIVVVAAAGNDRGDACQYSPGSEPLAICVGATDWLDNVVSSFNSGSCVDIYAPGLQIKSDWYTNHTATMVQSGTSSATAFVAGTAAVYLSALPEEVVPSKNLVAEVESLLYSTAAAVLYFDFINATLASECVNRLLQITC